MTENSERAGTPTPTIRYDILQAYADTHRLDFNELCRVVREAVSGELEGEFYPVPKGDPVGIAAKIAIAGSNVPVTTEMARSLSSVTDLPQMECKRALIEANGDMDAAKELLRNRFRNLAYAGSLSTFNK